jgi:hypothetical protein
MPSKKAPSNPYDAPANPPQAGEPRADNHPETGDGTWAEPKEVEAQKEDSNQAEGSFDDSDPFADNEPVTTPQQVPQTTIEAQPIQESQTQQTMLTEPEPQPQVEQSQQ